VEGRWLQLLVAVDAFVVLSGAVLTAYVGVVGLVRKLAQDRCLPQFLLRTNAWRGTNHNIIFGFFFIASSLLLILQHHVIADPILARSVDMSTLAGVYCFAFLGLLIFFTIGCMLLKFKRPGLPRKVAAGWGGVVLALVGASLGLVGNLVSKASALQYFLVYTLMVGAVMFVMFQRTFILKLYLKMSAALLRSFRSCHRRWDDSAKRMMAAIGNDRVVFFVKKDSLVVMNKAILYVRENEQAKRLVIVHCYDPEEGCPPKLKDHVRMLDSMYPKIKISCVCVEGRFDPTSAAWIGRELDVSMNSCFITCPDERFQHKVSDLGMRIITTVPSLDKVPTEEEEEEGEPLVLNKNDEEEGKTPDAAAARRRP
jgi:hypothetical protein